MTVPVFLEILCQTMPIEYSNLYLIKRPPPLEIATHFTWKRVLRNKFDAHKCHTTDIWKTPGGQISATVLSKCDKYLHCL